MDFETISPADFGRSLTGLGLNLLVADVAREVAFLTGVFGMTAHRVSADFAILAWRGQMFQLHADHTYHAHPLPGLLPEAGPRGAGAELRLYGEDPDRAAARFWPRPPTSRTGCARPISCRPPAMPGCRGGRQGKAAARGPGSATPALSRSPFPRRRRCRWRPRRASGRNVPAH